MLLSRWSFVSKAKPHKSNKVAVTSLRLCSLPACSSPTWTDQNGWAVQPSCSCLQRVWAAGTGDAARNGGGRQDSPVRVTNQNVMEQQQVLLLVKLDWLWLPVCLTQVGKTMKLCPQDSPRCRSGVEDWKRLCTVEPHPLLLEPQYDGCFGSGSPTRHPGFLSLTCSPHPTTNKLQT